MGSKGLHGAPITAPGCFPSGRYSPPPYRAAPDPMPPPPRRCMPNPTVSERLPIPRDSPAPRSSRPSRVPRRPRTPSDSSLPSLPRRDANASAIESIAGRNSLLRTQKAERGRGRGRITFAESPKRRDSSRSSSRSRPG